jgi:hypothetical protein
MLIINFNAGSLGHFLATLLKTTSPISCLDYGEIITPQVLHTGAYVDQNDPFFLKRKTQQYFAITHNNPTFNKWISTLKNNKKIYIDLDSCFVEYRLNYILKIPNWNKKLNDYAIINSWKNFKNPVACDDARRIIRLHQRHEQTIHPTHDDIIFNFKNFYVEDMNIWIENFIELGKKLSISLDKNYLQRWFECFRVGQKSIIERAKLLYECIKTKKFNIDLNENEKGIIIGYDAVTNNIDDPAYFIQRYYEFSKNLY